MNVADQREELLPVTRRTKHVLPLILKVFIVIACFLLFFALFLFYKSIQIPSEKCPPGFHYLSFTDSCYRVYIPPASFQIAKRTCEMQGYHLTSTHSAKESVLLRSIFNSSLAEYNRTIDDAKVKSDIWIGLEYLKYGKEWQWMDKSEVNYWSWSHAEPSLLEKGDFATVMLLDRSDYSPNGDKWKTTREWEEHSYICKQSLKKPKKCRCD